MKDTNKDIEETMNFIDSRLRKFNIDPDDLDSYFCYTAKDKAGIYKYVPEGKSYMVYPGKTAVDVVSALITVKHLYKDSLKDSQKLILK